MAAAAAAETAALHEGDDNIPLGPTGRGVKSQWQKCQTLEMLQMKMSLIKIPKGKNYR